MSDDILNGGLLLLTKRIERRTQMAKIMQKSVILSVVFGLLLAAAAPSAMAQDRCRRRGFTSSRYYNDDFRRDRYRYDYDRQDTKGKAVGRTAAGAGIGALAGALIGGGKGAAVGAVVGGAGGYIYHQQKVNNQYDRRRRRW
jgi:YmgG-like glycine-zipper protein